MRAQTPERSRRPSRHRAFRIPDAESPPQADGPLELDSVLRLECKGRGRALRAAWSHNPARVVAYMDVDLSSYLRALLPPVSPLLIAAQRRGMRIHEVAVDWVDDPDSRVEIIATALGDLRGVARLMAQTHPARPIASTPVPPHSRRPQPDPSFSTKEAR